MGGKQSSTQTSTRVRTYSSAGQGTSSGGGGLQVGAPSTSGGAISGRIRARSLSSVQNGTHGQPLTIPSNGGAHGAGPPDSDSSTPEDAGPLNHMVSRGYMQAQSLPLHLLSFHGKIFLQLTTLAL